MKKNKTAQMKPARRNNKAKKIVISSVAVILALAIGCSVWYYFGHRNTDPVFVYDFYYVGMTDYWGDSLESYGPVSTDKLQTVYLSGTQTVTEVYVQEGDTVSKGDPLMAYDTTLSDLALERKRLDVEKLKLQLDDAYTRLNEIKNMKPMVIPQASTTPTTPPEVNLGTPIGGPYQVISPDSSDGSTEELSVVCWLHENTQIDNDLFQALLEQVEEIRTEHAASQPVFEPDAGNAQPEGDVSDGESSSAADTEAAEETEAAAETEATEETESVEETEPETESADPEPMKITVNDFYAVFKTTVGSTSFGDIITWQGVYVTVNRDGDNNPVSYRFRFFDASGVEDPVTPPSTETDDVENGIDYGSGYTAAQIAEMRNEQEQTIKDIQFSIKMAEAEYKIMQTEVSDGQVYAEIDGTVVSLLSPEDAQLNQLPMIKVSGGGGFYVQGSVNELDKDNLRIGQEVTVMDWNSGMTYMGTIEEIGDYPTGNDYYSWSSNSNVSYYPFTVFVDGDADLQPGYYVDIQYSAGDTSETGIYLENPFLRTEKGKSYVYVQNEDGLLEKRYVTTGKSVWGSYTEILDGLSETDLIAFPYGKNVKEGAATKAGDWSDLYG